jgi:hypothetical protein
MSITFAEWLAMSSGLSGRHQPVFAADVGRFLKRSGQVPEKKDSVWSLHQQVPGGVTVQE